MPGPRIKEAIPYHEIEDAMTFVRRGQSVKDLQEMAVAGQPTPVSGDALAVYGKI